MGGGAIKLWAKNSSEMCVLITFGKNAPGGGGGGEELNLTHPTKKA